VENRIASYPIPQFTVFPMLYEPGRVILDFNSPFPRVAYGIESHIEVQILQKSRDYSCNHPKAFDLQYDFGADKGKFAPLELGHTRFNRNTYKLFIPRQKYDNLNEETRELSRTREYSYLESRLRTLGGLDGLSSRQICNGKKFEECVYKLDQITPGSDDAFYKLNGYFSLPDAPGDKHSFNYCYYCLRARTVFVSKEITHACKNRGRNNECYGEWSTGQEFKNPEDNSCHWEPQFTRDSAPPTLAPSSNMSPDPVQSQSSSIETQNQESSRRILLASLIIVVIVVISLVWVLCFCKNKKHGHIPGALLPTQNMPFSPSDRHTEEAMSVGVMSKCGSNSPCMDTATSQCSFLSRPVSRYSSKDSGIDRNSGSFRSDSSPDWENFD